MRVGFVREAGKEMAVLIKVFCLVSGSGGGLNDSFSILGNVVGFGCVFDFIC